MASNKNSDFVLEDDLDDDEEMLQIHSEQLQRNPDSLNTSSLDPPTSSHTASNTSVQSNPESSHPSVSPLPTDKEQTSQLSNTQLQQQSEQKQHSAPSNADASAAQATSATPSADDSTTAVIIDGLPLTARRADVDTLLQSATASIANVRLRRLERYSLLRMRVEFNSTEAAAAALTIDGQSFNDAVVSIKPASEERWNAAMSSDASVQSSRKEAPPAAPSLWSAFGVARSLAERFEQRAKHLGEQLEHQLHVADKIEDGKQHMRNVDRRFNVSATVTGLAQAGRDTATAVDKKFGISDGVATVVEGVGGAARIVANEVDENLRVSDKARSATNAAMTSPAIGGVARRVVSSFDATPSPSKSHQPRRLNLEEEAATASAQKARAAAQQIGDAAAKDNAENGKAL